ncbi:MAG TPA: flagellar FlbD family protein [Bryobacteraceae bacterium]|jgi:flagellar protein FlbD|nr:flagellar FlbD family protein [Bryobacteraceae bacterium]
MIHLTRINHVTLVLNSDLIEHIETTPDTVISLINGQKFVVLETTDEIMRKVIEFRRAIHQCAFQCGVAPPTE